MQKIIDPALVKSGFLYKGKDILINPDYEKLIPRPITEQRQALKESIQADGLNEALVINEKNILLDGHTRIRICKELGIKPTVIVKTFKNLEDEKKYVVVSNLKRRHLNALQIVELTLDLYEKIRDETNKGQWQNIIKTKKEEQEPIGSTNVRSSAYKYGQIIGVSKTQVEKAVFVLKNGTKEDISEVRDNKKSLHDVYMKVSGKVIDKFYQEEVKEKVNVLKANYRTSIGILYSILNGLSINNNNELKVSDMSRVCNLSHYAVLEKCNLLIKNKLVKEYRDKRNRYFKLTTEGLEMKKKFDDFKEYLKTYDMDREL